MQRSPIEWTDFTANPLKYRDVNSKIVWACVHCSPGCFRCYSEALAKRYKKGAAFTVPNMAGLTPFMDEKELRHMLTYKPASGKRCFVGDMTDLFGEFVPFELLDKLFAVFALRSDVTWQILTKRPERMREYISLDWRHQMVAEQTKVFRVIPWPLPNVWLGVSVENQQYADERIPILLQTPAAIRFVSYEPALGPVDFVGASDDENYLDQGSVLNSAGWKRNAALDWVIVGGESGPGARPFNIQWARNVIAQCKTAGVACFMKQYGAVPIISEAEWRERTERTGLTRVITPKNRDRKGGNIEEFEEELRVREFPQ